MNDKIKVVIADDHRIVRDGIKALLSDINEIEFCEEASNGHEVLAILKTQAVDLVLMDIEMPGLDGIEATAQIMENFQDVKVLALTMHADESHIIKMLQVGAMGYLLKNTNKKELLNAIKMVMSGESYFTKDVSGVIMKRYMKKMKKSSSVGSELTKRETEVLKLIAEENTNHEIADKLFISIRTVDTHRRNLLQKLNAKNTAGLVKFAIQHDLIDT